MCIMQSHKMTKLDMIISDLGPEERKSWMEKLQKDVLGEWKNSTIQYEVLFAFLGR